MCVVFVCSVSIRCFLVGGLLFSFIQLLLFPCFHASQHVVVPLLVCFGLALCVSVFSLVLRFVINFRV